MCRDTGLGSGARPQHEWYGKAPMIFLHLQILIDAMFEEATIFTRLQTSSLGLSFASPLLRLIQLIPNPRGPEGIEGDFIPYKSKSPSLPIPLIPLDWRLTEQALIKSSESEGQTMQKKKVIN